MRLFQPCRNLRIALSLRDHPHSELCRPDACEISPRKRFSCVVAQILIQRKLALLFYDICAIFIGMRIFLSAINVKYHFHTVIRKMHYHLLCAVLLLYILIHCLIGLPWQKLFRTHPHIMLWIKGLDQRV